MASTRVVLPWSTWAMMAMFLRFIGLLILGDEVQKAAAEGRRITARTNGDSNTRAKTRGAAGAPRPRGHAAPATVRADARRGPRRGARGRRRQGGGSRA